jgi:hypothetical protein
MNQHQVALLMAIAILNGIFSPAVALVFALWGLWYPFFLPASAPLVFALTSLIVSTLTLMIAGVPAAVYERARRRDRSDSVSFAIWLAGTLILTLPAFPAIKHAAGF